MTVFRKTLIIFSINQIIIQYFEFKQGRRNRMVGLFEHIDIKKIVTAVPKIKTLNIIFDFDASVWECDESFPDETFWQE